MCSLYCYLKSGIRRGKDIETAVVCNIFDSEGELAAAVASVEAIVSSLMKCSSSNRVPTF